MSEDEVTQEVEQRIKFHDDERHLGLIRELAEALVRKAELFGVVLTIEQRPLRPLAMRNYATCVDVRMFRGDKPVETQK